MIEAIKEWWPQMVAGVGMFAAYVAGKERTKANIKEVSDDMVAVKDELRKLIELTRQQSVSLAGVVVDIEWLKRNAERR